MASEKCDTCRLRYVCEEQAEFICKQRNYSDYQPNSQKTNQEKTEELKPCPFCGGKASLEHSGIDKTRSKDNGDLITTWRVWCRNCGTERKGGVSEYVFCGDETLRLMNPLFDGRRKAIEAWNRRA